MKNPKAEGPYHGGVTALDVFTKIFCKVEEAGVLGTRCDECPFFSSDGCLVRAFKERYWHDYKDFGPFEGVDW